MSFTQSNGLHSPLIYQHQSLLAPSRGGRKIGANLGFLKSDFFDHPTFYYFCKQLSGTSKASSTSITMGVLNEEERWEREEARWLREEKRWLREEERWYHEEARWNKEREALLKQSAAYEEEITLLKKEIARLEMQIADEKLKDRASPDLIMTLTSLLQSLKTSSIIETGGFVNPAQIPSAVSPAANISTPRADLSSQFAATGHGSKSSAVPPGSAKPEVKAEPAISSKKDSKSTAKTLKRGAEGDDVKEMQEALGKLGFYSGEEDMEYSVFSSGTERAVRSWQATAGVYEDGIMTAELMLKLLGGELQEPSKENETPKNQTLSDASGGKSENAKNDQDGTNLGFLPSKPEQKSTYVQVSHSRVYLLGENRWEEPERLKSNNGPGPGAAVLGGRCFSCKGQGTMMCTECEGTGELNVEEQFLEWADDGAKCPYCEGTTVIKCDVCDGTGVKVSAS